MCETGGVNELRRRLRRLCHTLIYFDIQAMFVSRLYPLPKLSFYICEWRSVAFEFMYVTNAYHCLYYCLLERHKWHQTLTSLVVKMDSNNTEAHSPCANYYYLQLTYYYCVTVVGPIVPWRSTKINDIEVKKRTKKTRKWRHIYLDLLIVFKTWEL